MLRCLHGAQGTGASSYSLYFVPASVDLRKVHLQKLECNRWPEADLDESACGNVESVTFSASE